MRKFLGMTPNALGTVLKKYRKTNGYTQQKVADYLGIDRSTYAKYENGRKPEVDVIISLSVLYNVSLDAFLSSFVEKTDDSSVNSAVISPLSLVSSPEVSEISDDLLIPLSNEEKRLLLYYRSSFRKSEIIKCAYDILCDDVSIADDVQEE